MNGLLKIFLGILIGFCLIGGLVVFFLVRAAGTIYTQTTETDPQKVASTARQIADFDLPAGYREEYSLHLAGYTLAAYNPGDEHSHLMLIQGPANLDINQANLEETLRKSADYSSDRTTGLRVVEERSITVRGQTVKAVISEGSNSDNQPYRELSVVFQGKSGPALLVIEEPIVRWDQAQIDAFLATIQ